ncbi:MAG: hypothetical protein ACP5IB_07585 [Thermoplasmata archaeon]
MIDLSNLKETFISRYPTHPLSKTLIHTDNQMSEEAFLVLVKVWLSILNEER